MTDADEFDEETPPTSPERPKSLRVPVSIDIDMDEEFSDLTDKVKAVTSIPPPHPDHPKYSEEDEEGVTEQIQLLEDIVGEAQRRVAKAAVQGADSLHELAKKRLSTVPSEPEKE